MICTKCQIDKPIEDFYHHRGPRQNRTQRDSHCKKCKNLATAARRRAIPNYYRKRSRRKTYGITWENFELLYNSQNKQCVICKKDIQMISSPGKQDAACLDHNHTTGQLRAILCGHCNKGIGFFRESPHLLREAASYLELFAPGGSA